MSDYFRFGLIFIKKNNQTEFFLKKPKPVQTGLARLGFLPVWLGFFLFGFFGFKLIKPKPNRLIFKKF
jgi:hypothetical protein